MLRRPSINIIVAVDRTGGYAKGREIPWSFQADWNHFKKVTTNNVCVMGRGTYEDIAERRRKRTPNFRVLLPKRNSFVVSRTLTNAPGPKQVQGATVIHNLEDIRADKVSNPNSDIFLLGGFHLWVQHWNRVDKIYMTIVPGKYDTTKTFPIDWIDQDFHIVDGRKEETDQGEIMFVEYWRRKR